MPPCPVVRRRSRQRYQRTSWNHEETIHMKCSLTLLIPSGGKKQLENAKKGEGEKLTIMIVFALRGERDRGRECERERERDRGRNTHPCKERGWTRFPSKIYFSFDRSFVRSEKEGPLVRSLRRLPAAAATCLLLPPFLRPFVPLPLSALASVAFSPLSLSLSLSVSVSCLVLGHNVRVYSQVGMAVTRT